MLVLKARCSKFTDIGKFFRRNSMKFNSLVCGLLKNFAIAGIVATCVASSANGQVNFNFTFTDGAGTGFNDTTDGAARRGALESSADILESMFINYTATINIDVSGGLTNDGILASAGSTYSPISPVAGFGSQGDVMKKILGGNAADPNSGATDGTINWNFEDHSWEYGNDFQSGEFDFISTAIHELAHTVGFLSGIQQDGSDLWSTNIADPSTWEAFDEFVADSTGALINGSTFIMDEARWDIASVGGTANNGLFFIGANAMAANGGNAVNLYSPSTWNIGSSGTHLDDELFGNTLTMESALTSGLGNRGLGAIERGILMDIGYANLVAVPEPSGMLVLGALATVGLLRRRKIA